MGRVTTTDWYRSGRRSGTSKFEGRKELIARAARACLERKGVGKTSIADITREVDITRELFYYYYPNKDAVVEAVVSDYIADARRLLTQAVESSADEAQDLLLHVLGALRAWLATDESMPVTMTDVLRESDSWMTTICAVAGEVLEALRGTVLLAQDEVLTETSSCGRRIGLMGAMSAMVCCDALGDADMAAGIAPLFC